MIISEVIFNKTNKNKFVYDYVYIKFYNCIHDLVFQWNPIRNMLLLVSLNQNKFYLCKMLSHLLNNNLYIIPYRKHYRKHLSDSVYYFIPTNELKVMLL